MAEKKKKAVKKEKPKAEKEKAEKKRPEPEKERPEPKEKKPEPEEEEEMAEMPEAVEKPSPKEIVDKVYDLVEIARSTGKIKKGTNEVTKSVERSEPKLVVVADDTEPKEIVMHLPALCKERGITLVTVPSKQELGTSCGLEVTCSAVAVIDGGEAKDILLKITKAMKGA